jgi:hypothetical protein
MKVFVTFERTQKLGESGVMETPIGHLDRAVQHQSGRRLLEESLFLCRRLGSVVW